MENQGKSQKRAVLEDFTYRIPGIMEERALPEGGVAFEFEADESRKDERRGKATAVDTTTTAGVTEEIRVIADTITSVPAWRFESGGRGQYIFPAKAEVMLQGNQTNPNLVALSAVQGNTARPVYSVPMIDPRRSPKDLEAPGLKFEGASLWTLSNAKGPFTAAATMDYRDLLVQGFQKLNGKVTVHFIFAEPIK